MADRTLAIPPARLAGWLARFHENHDVTLSEYDGAVARFCGDDETIAVCTAPFGDVGPPQRHADFYPEPLLAHVLRKRTVGVLLARLGGYAAGVFVGLELVAGKVGSRLVHGRHRAGGSSSGRFARRRDNEERQLIAAATDVAARVLVPHADRLDVLVVGGARVSIDRILADTQLTSVGKKLAPPFLNVPDPRERVLRATPEQFLATRISVVGQRANA